MLMIHMKKIYLKKRQDYGVRVEDEDVDDPAIVECLEIDPQYSTLGVQIIAHKSDSESDHVG